MLSTVKGAGPQLVMDSSPLIQAPSSLRLAAVAKGSGWGRGGRVWVEVVRGTEPVWAWAGVEPNGEGALGGTFNGTEARAGDLLRVSESLLQCTMCSSMISKRDLLTLCSITIINAGEYRYVSFLYQNMSVGNPRPYFYAEGGGCNAPHPHPLSTHELRRCAAVPEMVRT